MLTRTTTHPAPINHNPHLPIVQFVSPVPLGSQIKFISFLIHNSPLPSFKYHRYLRSQGQHLFDLDDLFREPEGDNGNPSVKSITSSRNSRLCIGAEPWYVVHLQSLRKTYLLTEFDIKCPQSDHPWTQNGLNPRTPRPSRDRRS